MLSLLLLALLSGACTPILQSDFDSFVAGDPPPNGALPGDPPGDFMFSAGEVTVSAANWLGFLYAPGLTLPASAEFHVGGLPHNTSNYYVTFIGRRFDTTSTPAIFTLRAANGLVAARLRLVNGDIELFSGLGWETLGNYETMLNHNVWIRLDQQNQEVTVQVAQLGLPTVSLASRPYGDPGFDELQRMEVALGVLGSSEATQYFMDELLIERQNPPSEESELAKLLDQWTSGDERALDRLIPLAWDRYHRRQGNSPQSQSRALEELKRLSLDGDPTLTVPDDALGILVGSGWPNEAP
jgi:hypothetical protein